MRRFSQWILLGNAAALISGCFGGTGGGSRPATASMPASAVTTAAPLAAAAYFAVASSIDLFELQSAHMALERAQNADNRALAQMLIETHKGTSAQLSFAGRRLNMLPSATLLPEQQAMLDELTASTNFDATYRQQQLRVHQEALKLHGDFAKAGSSPTLRPVAQNAEATYRRHYDMLRRMR